MTTAASGVPDGLRQAFGYCVQQVRDRDYENYIWCIQLPKELRPPALALRAFNVETGLIADHAKSEMLIMMRCQWWRDAVNSTFNGSPPEQPVMLALAHVLQTAPLTRYRLQRIVSAREDSLLRKGPPKTVRELENEMEGVSSQLLHLHMEAAGVAGPGTEDDNNESTLGAYRVTASHLGKAIGLVGLLRGTVHHAERGVSYLPEDLCDVHGTSPSDLLKGVATPELRSAVRELAERAGRYLEMAREKTHDVVPWEARCMLLPAVAAGMYLNALKSADYNLFDPGLARGGISPLKYQLQLKLNMLRGVY